MSREIKFRAYHDEKMHYFYLSDTIAPSLEFNVMQFTGLKDKNGTEIYEGDIVLFPNNSKVHCVDFYQSGFVLKSVDGQIVVYNIKPRYTEIIGNIHENPELLK